MGGKSEGDVGARAREIHEKEREELTLGLKEEKKNYVLKKKKKEVFLS